MTRKQLKGLVVFFVLYLFASTISLFIIGGFGSNNYLIKTFLFLINFPVRYNDQMSDFLFWIRFLINDLFWTVVLLVLLKACVVFRTK